MRNKQIKNIETNKQTKIFLIKKIQSQNLVVAKIICFSIIHCLHITLSESPTT